MNPTIELAVRVVVFLVMATVGMDLRLRDFQRVRDRPRLVPGVVIGHWIALPLIGGLVGTLFAPSDQVTGALLLVAAAPAAALSCFYAQLAAGDLALATTLAAVSNVLAFLVTPLVAATAFHLFLGSTGTFDLPLAPVAQQTLVGLLLPVLAGMLIRHRLGERVERWRASAQATSLVAVVSVLALAVVDEYATIRSQFLGLLQTAILFTATGSIVGVVIARIATSSPRDRKALPWAFPARNVAVAALIATAAGGESVMVPFFAVLFATQLALLTPMALLMGRGRNVQ